MSLFEQITAIDAQYPWFFALWAFVFGACWGSFYNVVIYRYPAGKSLIKPGSHCYACQTPIKWYDNLPILSWFILRGKARCCGAPFSVRYAMVELMTGLLYMWAWIVYGPSIGVVLCVWIFLALLICNGFIDYDTQYLMDMFTVGGMVLGVVLSGVYPELHGQAGSGDPWMLESLRSVSLSITGAAVGSGVILWIGMVASKALGKDAMGFGDVLLMGCVGAFVGWEGAVFAIFGGSIVGSLAMIAIMLFNVVTGANVKPGKIGAVDELETGEAPAKDAPADTVAEGEAKQEDGEQELGFGVEIPFGPWLSLGAVIYLLAVRGPVDAYFDSMKTLIFAPVNPY